jgi:hypothetical protein
MVQVFCKSLVLALSTIGARFLDRGSTTMSFGVGIGDIFLVPQLAKKTVDNCCSAPSDLC